NVFDAQTGKKVFTLKGHSFEVSGMAFSPDGKTVVTFGRGDHTIRTWSLATGKLLRSVAAPRCFAGHPVFSPDSKCFAISYQEQNADGSTRLPCRGSVKVYDATSGRELHTIPGDPEPLGPLAFGPKGAVLAAGSPCRRQPVVRLWKLPLRKQ